MQINSVIPVIPSNSSARQGERLLNAILDGGMFRAVVVQRQQGMILLDTPWGRIRGKGPDTLKRGDEVLARMEKGHNGNGLKIVQHFPSSVKIPAQNLQQIFAGDISSPKVATVLQQQPKHTVVAVNNSAYRVPGLKMFEQGDRLMLTADSERLIEVKRIHPETMIKAALAELLPKDPDKGLRVNTLGLQTLASALGRTDIEKLLLLVRPQSGAGGGSGDLNPVSTNPSGPTATAKQSSMQDTPVAREQTAQQSGQAHNTKSQTLHNTALVTSILHAIAKPLVDLKAIDGNTVQQILQSLGFSQPSSNTTATTAHIRELLPRLIEILKQHPEVLERVLNQALKSLSGSRAGKVGETIQPGFDIALRNELIQQSENLLGQITIHKALLNTQHETQQPLQLNLSLPLQADQETRELNLKIRQNKRNAEGDDDAHWDMQLSFDLGNLGPMTIRLQIHGIRIAAQFWAEQTSTKILIDDHIVEFRSQLLRVGFEPGLIDCFLGQPVPRDEPPPAGTDYQNLVDLKA